MDLDILLGIAIVGALALNTITSLYLILRLQVSTAHVSNEQLDERKDERAEDNGEPSKENRLARVRKSFYNFFGRKVLRPVLAG